MIKVEKVVGYNCPSKYLVNIDGKNICFCNSNKQANELVKYYEGYKADVHNGKILKILNKLRKESDKNDCSNR